MAVARAEFWRRTPGSVSTRMEPCPPELARQDFPRYGGMLCFNGEGVACCPVCAWRGAPTIVDGVISTHCPACNAVRPSAREPRVAKLSRNAPCPCGSGVKAKKCPCEEFEV